MGWNPFSSAPSSAKPDIPAPSPAASSPVVDASRPPLSPSIPTSAPSSKAKEVAALTPPGTTVAPQASTPAEQYRELKAIISLGLVITMPLLLIMPPRRFNAISMIQTGMLGWGFNEQSEYRTGRSVLDRMVGAPGRPVKEQ
ncbi:hypothetical protein BT63DRAFT_453986 [Microthyrium microscopicum]|uniref:Uncharacterized protein n=1 Tax=Microthyrium microscopicum TaxID=703497 RepID=A0A6A6UE24_9PEZI|nr:hypothetical protein BT63DRAFT_453986 [Microthyrium microscopicum]